MPDGAGDRSQPNLEQPIANVVSLVRPLSLAKSTFPSQPSFGASYFTMLKPTSRQALKALEIPSAVPSLILSTVLFRRAISMINQPRSQTSKSCDSRSALLCFESKSNKLLRPEGGKGGQRA